MFRCFIVLIVIIPVRKIEDTVSIEIIKRIHVIIHDVFDLLYGFLVFVASCKSQ